MPVDVFPTFLMHAFTQFLRAFFHKDDFDVHVGRELLGKLVHLNDFELGDVHLLEALAPILEETGA